MNECNHDKVYKDPDLLGEITPRLVCQQCGKEWNYPGRLYLDMKDPKALKQLEEYKAMEGRARWASN